MPSMQIVSGIMLPNDLSPQEHFEVKRLELIGVAWWASRNLAVSYRNCHYGVAAMGWNEETRCIAVAAGGNNTPYKGAPKCCAEYWACRCLYYMECTSVLGMALVGPGWIDSESGLVLPVADPCDWCRREVSAIPGVHDDMRLVTMPAITDITDPQQWGVDVHLQTWGGMLAKHARAAKLLQAAA